MALSPLKNKQIEAFHDKGLTVKEIGRKTHCSHAEIRQLLKSKGKEPIEEKKAEKEIESVPSESYETASSTSQVLKKVKDEMSKIYKRLSEQNQHAWDLGVVFAEVCKAMEEETK